MIFGSVLTFMGFQISFFATADFCGFDNVRPPYLRECPMLMKPLLPDALQPVFESLHRDLGR